MLLFSPKNPKVETLLRACMNPLTCRLLTLPPATLVYLHVSAVYNHGSLSKKKTKAATYVPVHVLNGCHVFGTLCLALLFESLNKDYSPFKV